MARRYEQGVLVGEPDPPKTLPEIIQWALNEQDLARERALKAKLTARTYLHDRLSVLGEMLNMLELLGLDTP